ncbi:DUF2079 domain-containing protein [Flindersiella endophytica]
MAQLRLSRHRVCVGLVCLTAAFTYATVGLLRLRNFRATTFDLVIFDQAVRGYAGFGPPTTPARGAFLGQGTDFIQLGDHFSPMLAVLAPLYWIHDGPQTLIVAQAVLLAAAVPPLWLYTRRKLGTVPAYLVAVVYVASAAVCQAAAFDFHEVAFVPLLLAVLIERFDAGRPWQASLAAFGLLLVKEDLDLLLAGFGCFLLLTRRRAFGAAYLVGGISAMALIRGVLIPAMGGDPTVFWAYEHLGANVPEVLHTVVTDPLLVLTNLVSPQVKLVTMLELVGPLLFACLLSPLFLAAVPLLLERMLSNAPTWWAGDFHYDAFVIVVAICAGVDGVARVQHWLTARDLRLGLRPRSLAVAWAALACGVTLALLPQNPVGRLFDPTFYRDDRDVAAARAAAKAVPEGVTVEAANHVGPSLSQRRTVLLWDARSHGAPWVVADTKRPDCAKYTQPRSTCVRTQRKQVAKLLRKGYRVVYVQNGYVVLHRVRQ